MSASRQGALLVQAPSGTRTKVVLNPLPFKIGRAPDNHLVLRDNRASRAHATIQLVQDEYFVQDLKSRAGVYLNGKRIEDRARLHNGDRIDFGLTDSYVLTFALEEVEIERLLGQFHPAAAPTAGTSNLARLRALVDVARALQTSLSIEDVLSSVVDAALTVTGAERGFLLMRNGEALDVRIARERSGAPLPASDLSVPTRLIHHALNNRRELLSMNFDPSGEQGFSPDRSVANLELRSVVCVPLVHVRSGSAEETSVVSAANETVGVLYMDSRAGAADLSHGGRELLQTLALEASTVLENARLLEEERAKQQLEKELSLAQEIQSGLLPKTLPDSGWFRAAGSSQPSHLVGGDYFDIQATADGCRVAVVADVSGKGVSSALLAALLQGAFLLASESPMPSGEMMRHVNHFLNERTCGEKYATLIHARFQPDGLLTWVNAGHCPPFLLREGALSVLSASGLPVGLLETVEFEEQHFQLLTGDKLILYTDGVSEAQNARGEFFGLPRLRSVILEQAHGSCREIHDAIGRAVTAFAGGAVQTDDITLVVIEYAPQ